MDTGVRYRFRPDQIERLLALCGRRDTAAMHLADDLERALGAYFATQGKNLIGGLPEAIGRDLKRVGELASELRRALYALPTEVTQLIELQITTESVQNRIRNDLAQLAAPLEDLVTAVTEIQHSGAGPGASAAFEPRLLKAFAQSYRNRLNLPLSSDLGGHFARFVRGVLEIAAEDAPQLKDVLARFTSVELERLARHDVEAGLAPTLVHHDPWDPPVKGIGE